MSIKLFYVLNGLLDGERGVAALTTDGHQLRDGHYFLFGDQSDPMSRHPHSSREDAWDAGLKAERTQTWLFPLDGSRPYQYDGDASEIPSDGTNVASIERMTNDNHYECRVEGSYETLILRISVPTYAAAADVFAWCLIQQAKYL